MDEKQVVLDSTRHHDVVSQQQNTEIQVAPPPDYSAPKAKTEQLEDARGWESENLIQDLDKQLEQSGYKKGFFDIEFKNPISGANLTLPEDLHLTAQQNSLVNSGMPLGGQSFTFTSLDQS
jgi:hypothetical protein